MVSDARSPSMIRSVPSSASTAHIQENDTLLANLFGQMFCCAATPYDPARNDLPLFDLQQHQGTSRRPSLIQSGYQLNNELTSAAEVVASCKKDANESPKKSLLSKMKPFCSKSYSQPKLTMSSLSRHNSRGKNRSPTSAMFPVEEASPVSIRRTQTASTASIHSRSTYGTYDTDRNENDDDTAATYSSSIVAYHESLNNSDDEMSTVGDVLDDYDATIDWDHAKTNERAMPPAIQLAHVIFSSPNLSHDIDHDFVAEVDKEERLEQEDQQQQRKQRLKKYHRSQQRVSSPPAASPLFLHRSDFRYRERSRSGSSSSNKCE